VSTAVLADASALVALWSPADQYHEWAKGCFAKYSPPIFTCEAVLTEAAWLLRQFPASRSAVLAAWRREVLVIEFQAQAHRDALVSLMKRYEDIPMSFADSCLVRMSELTIDCSVWTLDTDFKIYRRLGRRAIPLLIPDS
jgi:predicted nucleic acid-binding protein